VRVGIYYKRSSRLAAEVALKVAEECSKRDLKVYVEFTLLEGDRESSDIAEAIKRRSSGVYSLESPEVDVIAVVGGDGTLLRVLHMLGDPKIPIMAIRMGRRGYLLDVTPIEIPERVEDLVRGRYRVVEYMRLSMERDGVRAPPALNEVAVVSTGMGRSKVVRLKIYKDEKPLYFMEGDGVIVATPIGSTAYSMAAGGPILDHSLKGFVITPLAPVQTWLRPIVVNMDSKIRIAVAEDSLEAYAIVDGQFAVKIEPGKTVLVERHPQPARIMRFHDIDNSYDRVFMR